MKGEKGDEVAVRRNIPCHHDSSYNPVFGHNQSCMSEKIPENLSSRFSRVTMRVAHGRISIPPTGNHTFFN